MTAYSKHTTQCICNYFLENEVKKYRQNSSSGQRVNRGGS